MIFKCNARLNILFIFFLGMSGVVDYSNYDDMKYAVSFISLQCLSTFSVLHAHNLIFFEASVGSLMFP